MDHVILQLFKCIIKQIMFPKYQKQVTVPFDKLKAGQKKFLHFIIFWHGCKELIRAEKIFVLIIEITEEKLFFAFKVSIKTASADTGKFYDLTDGDG